MFGLPTIERSKAHQDLFELTQVDGDMTGWLVNAHKRLTIYEARLVHEDVCWRARFANPGGDAMGRDGTALSSVETPCRASAVDHTPRGVYQCSRPPT